ncbi:MAG: hypothetical protein V4710_14285 [Verrucomicrobiota bacterium]
MKRDLIGWMRLNASLIPWRLWSALAAVAVFGSFLYGASLGMVLPEWQPGAAALWLALSAGLAWMVFIPVIWLLCCEETIAATTACLLAMAAGEIVLGAGALINAITASRGGFGEGDLAIFFNAGVVAFSNVVMAAVLTVRLRRLGVPAWQTLGAWTIFLNGSGALFFAFFFPFLHGL